MQKETDNWFASWFNTPYYHILYKDRDYEEAGNFMNQLTSYLQLPIGAKIMDLACGKGRHAKYLNKLGYEVTGVDLSPESIAYAKKFENDTLHFEVHDMCKPYPRQFDGVFNLFTSFGYFESEEDNLRTIKAIKSNLKENGRGVIDFLNVQKVKKHLNPKEKKTVGDITFSIERYLENDYIFKDIKFSDKGQDYFFTERVKALHLEDFKDYFDQAGVRLTDCFGNYSLAEFDEETSERLILIFGK
ncbi:class I SAM-dependent methyltransferase [Constantimarinum furrinae]|uniref:Methyltransferase n=1 Tax=Constantimarinum furrinae TaxID=2562285 RepID=A0A7G8PX44_9FLAO|nr:class I SAM-dependent methyltransferase [Constantimarinum furrinae]QNJ98910.1 methyltransferase [Constantimarinum furrinae]